MIFKRRRQRIRKMPNAKFTNDSLVTFFALTFLLSLPFYILCALAYQSIIGNPNSGPIYIALVTITPIASASILTFRRHGNRGLKKLLRRTFDIKRITKKRWYIVIFLLSPFIFLLSLMWVVLSGASAPPALTPFAALPAVILFFFLLAAGEEVGWMGYAYEALQAQGSALRAALVLGMIWALWHVPFFVFMMPDPFVLIPQILSLVGIRILIVWIFNNTGKSVFAAILFHAVDNAALVTFPEIMAVKPRGPIVYSSLVMIAAIVVILLWGWRSLARYRFTAELKGTLRE